jgi:hypothetical protein
LRLFNSMSSGTWLFMVLLPSQPWPRTRGHERRINSQHNTYCFPSSLAAWFLSPRFSTNLVSMTNKEQHLEIAAFR